MPYRTDRINQAGDYFTGAGTPEGYHRHILGWLKLHNVPAHVVQQPVTYDARGRSVPAVNDHLPAVTAYVNHGRWVAECECGAAMLVAKGYGFLCGECGNRQHGYRYRPIAWPQEQVQIERELLRRPVEEMRNWFPHESLTRIKVESDRIMKAFQMAAAAQKAGAG